ncbi:MAG: phospholipase [Polaromonas sp.]|nr:phospholipase [Polaromonas sp.]
MTFTTSPLHRLLLASGLLAASLAQAQTAAPAVNLPANRPSSLGWQVCQAIKNDNAAQLACYERWADSQLPANTPPAALAATPADPATGKPATEVLLLPSLNTDAPDGKPIGCRNTQYSELSRFWELQRGSDCDTFAIRGYRPISLALVQSDGSNSPQVDEALSNIGFKPPALKKTETKIQLSVRTKVAKGLLKSGDSDEDDQDSLWFGYSQQSYWQLFTPAVSRPFRATDHEPEVIYIYPHQIALPGGWQYRLSGLGLVHQSNGQSNLLSRSWNRTYLLGAAEKVLGPESSLRLQGRIWDRLRESGIDDNPGIENYIGRAELNASWQVNKANTLGLTLRHSLRSQARGSTRIDWMMAPADSPTYTGLRYHVQLFTGYGDSLLDYNKRRNVLSVGLSLVDW